MINTKKSAEKQLRLKQLKAQTSKDYSFDDVKDAFYASDKNGLDPVLVDFASNWFDAITKEASRTAFDNPRQDERLLDIAFSDDIGRKTFDLLKNCYMGVLNDTDHPLNFTERLCITLFNRKNVPHNKYGDSLFSNLAYMEKWYTQYGYPAPDFNPNVIGDIKFVDIFKFEQSARVFMVNCHQAKLAQQKLEKNDDTITKKIKRIVKKVFSKESEQDDEQITKNIQTPK